MKKLLFIVPILLMAFTSCTEKPKQNPQTEKEVKIAPEIHRVIVIKKQDAGTYTYLKVSENDKTYWIAASKMDVAKGDTLFYSKSMEMKKFKSTELNKTFDSILFVDKISSSKKPMNIVAHPKIEPATKTKVTTKRSKGSITIKKLYSSEKSFNGKTVKVEGKVTKINTKIMNRNWIHIQDGTSYKGKYDLLITSNVIVTKGSYVIMEGVVAIDKDFGAGYKYPLLVENSKLIKEIK
jgi:GW (Gly-Tryp) dipeptide domain